MSPMIVPIPTVGRRAINIFTCVGHHGVRAVVFNTRRAFFTGGLEAGGVDGAYADAVAESDVAHCLLAYTDGFADDFVADADGWSMLVVLMGWCWWLGLRYGVCQTHKHPSYLNSRYEVTYWSMSRAKSMQISGADTTMSDLNVHICLLERLWLVFLPHQLSLSGLWVKAHPAFEFVVLSHIRCEGLSIGDEERWKTLEKAVRINVSEGN